MRLRVALLVAVVAALATAPGAHAASRTAFGVTVTSPLEASPQQVRSELARARSLGARRVRFLLHWSAVEPEPGRIDPAALARLDAGFREARRRGIKVLGLFIGSPCWATSGPAGDCYRWGPRDPAAATLAATTLARRYKRDLAAFELWNEPDHRNEAYWAGGDKVARYVAFVRALYRPLKRAAPRVPVLAGAFVGTDGRWLQALYAAGMRGHYDALSVHFYDLTLNALRTTRAVQRRWRDRKPVWVAETGWSSCAHRATIQDGHLCTTRAAQARQTADLVRALRRTSYVKGVVFYTLQDSSVYDFGMYDRRGRRKPAGSALRSELRRKRTRATRRLVIRLRRTSRGLRITGTGPGGDLYTVQATGNGFRYRGSTRLDRRGRIDFTLPAQLGTRGITVRVRHRWTGRTAVRRS